MSGQSKSWRVGLPTAADLEELHARQMETWPQARDNYAALRDVQLRRAGSWEVQFNPARAVSAGACVDHAAIAARPCFLCSANRPVPQLAILWRGYEILVNPFPIFSRHYTVASVRHEPQSLGRRLGDMAGLAAQLPGYVVFYNGPHCGASAPDHAHLQIAEWPGVIDLLTADCAVRRVIELDGAAHVSDDDVNAFAINDRGRVRLFVVPRRAHRPADYATTLISPGAVDVAGRIITVRREIYDSLTGADIENIYSQVCHRPLPPAEQ